MIKRLFGLLAGWKGYAAAFAAGAVLAGAAAGYGAWKVRGWRYEAQIAGMQRDKAVEQAKVAHTALDQINADITTIAQAGRRAAAVAPQLTAEVNKLSGALKDAKPLPADCHPDVVRLHNLEDTVRATNRAATGQRVGQAVPTDTDAAGQ